jgi:hypothetical protein
MFFHVVENGPRRSAEGNYLGLYPKPGRAALDKHEFSLAPLTRVNE